MKQNLISLAQQFLIGMLVVDGTAVRGISPEAMQSKMTDGFLYIKTEITGADGIKNLITSSTLFKVGTSSFDKQRLPSGVKMALSQIRLGIAVVDAANGDPAAAQAYINQASQVPAKFRGADFIINRGGKEILRVPVLHCLTLDDVQGMVGEADSYSLDAFRYLQGDEQLDLQLEFPDNIAWAAGKKVFVSVELLGPRAQA